MRSGGIAVLTPLSTSLATSFTPQTPLKTLRQFDRVMAVSLRTPMSLTPASLKYLGGFFGKISGGFSMPHPLLMQVIGFNHWRLLAWLLAVGILSGVVLLSGESISAWETIWPWFLHVRRAGHPRLISIDAADRSVRPRSPPQAGFILGGYRASGTGPMAARAGGSPRGLPKASRSALLPARSARGLQPAALASQPPRARL